MDDQVTDRRVRRTRRALGEALLDLIEESGYEAVTVAEVVARADVSRATFYLHYPDREHLLLDTVDTLLGELEETIKPLTAEGLARGEERSVHLFRAVAGRHGLWRALLTERGSAVVQSRVRARLAAFIERNTTTHLVAAALHPIDAGLLAAHSSGSLLGLLIWWLEHDLPESAERMGDLFRQLNTVGAAGTLGLTPPDMHGRG